MDDFNDALHELKLSVIKVTNYLESNPVTLEQAEILRDLQDTWLSSLDKRSSKS